MNPAMIVGAILSGLGVAIMVKASKQGDKKGDTLQEPKQSRQPGARTPSDNQGPDSESNSGDSSGRAGNADSVESGDSAETADAASAEPTEHPNILEADHNVSD